MTVEYLDDRELAKRLRISRVTVQHWRQRGEGPPYARIGRSVRYLWSDVEGWLKSRTVGGAAA